MEGDIAKNNGQVIGAGISDAGHGALAALRSLGNVCRANFAGGDALRNPSARKPRSDRYAVPIAHRIYRKKALWDFLVPRRYLQC